MLHLFAFFLYSVLLFIVGCFSMYVLTPGTVFHREILEKIPIESKFQPTVFLIASILFVFVLASLYAFAAKILD